MKPPSPSSSKPPGWFEPPLAQKVQALLQQGWALHQGGQAAQALSLYEQVLKLQPKHFDALHLSGVIALQSGDFQRAVDLITKALKVDRDNAMAYDNRGSAYVALQQYDLALLNYNKAIALQPDHENGYNNRGSTFVKLQRFTEALADFDKAIALKPDYFEAHNNRSNTLSGLGRHQEALASNQRAAALNPQSAAARWNLGMCALRLGDFALGWDNYEWRLPYWRERGWQDHDHAAPMWTGAEPLSGKTILLHSEQGLGDTIQFCRYASLVHALGASVILEVQPSLAPLLASLPNVTLVKRGEPLPAFDTYCPLMSLPRALKTRLDSIPLPPDMVSSTPDKLALWQGILGPRHKPRVGIVWSGNASHVDDHRRSMSLQTFTAILSDDIAWVSLHKEVRDTDLPTLAQHPEIAHFGDAQQDFTDAAAMCDLVDLVICVDTSIAHVAATMGRPVWLLLSQHADWRWLLDRRDTPWYPSMTLYRQPATGDWASVLAEVKVDLQRLFKH